MSKNADIGLTKAYIGEIMIITSKKCRIGREKERRSLKAGENSGKADENVLPHQKARPFADSPISGERRKMKRNHTNDKNGNVNDTDEIKELCSELTMENKKYVAAVAKALYFAQNAERASAFQKMGFLAEDPKGGGAPKKKR